MTKKLERQLRTSARLAHRDANRLNIYNRGDDQFYRLSSALRRAIDKGFLPENATKEYLTKVRQELDEAHRRMLIAYGDYAGGIHALATLLGVR